MLPPSRTPLEGRASVSLARNIIWWDESGPVPTSEEFLYPGTLRLSPRGQTRPSQMMSWCEC